MDCSREYDRFAWVYNRHWGHCYIPELLPVLGKLVLQRVPPPARILDLCCGAGQLAKTLHERGYRVTGLDISAEMLHYARQNAPSVELIQGNACSFSLPEPVDVVVSTCDSLNHIMVYDELAAAFRCVHNALKEGGLFFFDLNMEESYRVCDGDSYGIVEDEMACIVRFSYAPEKRTASYNMTVFQKKDTWQRSDFTFHQRYYPEPEVRRALEDAGFTEIRVAAYQRPGKLRPLTDSSERAFFTCRKPDISASNL